MDVNYFVCTLGQAARLENGTPYKNVNHLIDEQARTHAKLPAVGFYIPTSQSSSSLKHHILSFEDVRRLSMNVAHLVKDCVDLPARQTVSLLSASSPEFLFLWLALIRLGHPVLLIAPQCSPSAIAHLSKACDAPALFHDDSHADLADRAEKSSLDIGFPIHTYPLPFDSDQGVLQLLKQKSESEIISPEISENHIAYLHHSSGTSTGIPKPIPQSHRAAVGVLPSLSGSDCATFTTTPLYHGGVADLFRAWSSSALIWLFPSQHLPITASNIVSCLKVSKAATSSSDVPHIKYFSSVPYILQMMAEYKVGLQQLQSMDIVGVGGAALPTEVGNKLVENGVNLISRFGSAECGFLMSSHRDYTKNTDWQYLRHDTVVSELKFEPQDAGLSELVITDGWPHMAKRNRDNGSFATADLFIPHPKISHAWKYHSRADSQLTLITGKKFDPAPLEDSITAASNLIHDVLIFGNGKSYPGILLFRSKQAADVSDNELIQKVGTIIEKFNSESQGHARIPRNMLVPMPFIQTPLEKSSKGTILRGRAEEVYDEQIESAYQKITGDSNKDISDQELPNAALETVKLVLGLDDSMQQTLEFDTDLFAHGVDSVACVQIRHALSQFIPKDSSPLPLTVVEDCGTVSKLSTLLIRIRHGEEAIEQDDQRELLSALVKKYSTFKTHSTAYVNGLRDSSEKTTKGLHILLTGPTGSLGSHILQQLSTNPEVSKIYLLVRGATQHAARERVMKALSQRKLHISSENEQKLIIMPYKLAEPQLGLTEDDYQTLTSKIDIIFHLAWSVNFLMGLQSFASTHLAGLQNLLNLALSSNHQQPPKFLFCSSVASTSNLINKTKTKTNKPIPEAIVEDITAAGPTGYALSKLAAELICSNCANETALNGRITVLRVGQLSGDTKHGVWNKSEAYPLILGSSKVTNSLPDLGHEEKLSWLPVDIAAKGFIEAASLTLHGDQRDNNNNNSSSHTTSKSTSNANKIKVLHLLNPSTKTTWIDFLSTLQKSGTHFKTLPPSQWLDELESLQNNESTKNHPALKLLPFWRGVYSSEEKSLDVGVAVGGGGGGGGGVSNEEVGDVKMEEVKGEGKGGEEEEEYAYEIKNSIIQMPSIKEFIGGLSEEYLLMLWGWCLDECWFDI